MNYDNTPITSEDNIEKAANASTNQNSVKNKIQKPFIFFKTKIRKGDTKEKFRLIGKHKNKKINFEAIIDKITFEITYPVRIVHSSGAQIILTSSDSRSFQIPKSNKNNISYSDFLSHIYAIENSVRACIDSEKAKEWLKASQPVRIAPMPGDSCIIKDIYIENNNVIAVSKWSSLSTPMVPKVHTGLTKAYRRGGQAELDYAVLSGYGSGKIRLHGKKESILRYIDALESDDAYLIRKKFEKDIWEKTISPELGGRKGSQKRYEHLLNEAEDDIMREIAKSLLIDPYEPSEEVANMFSETPAIDEEFMSNLKWQRKYAWRCIEDEYWEDDFY